MLLISAGYAAAGSILAVAAVLDSIRDLITDGAMLDVSLCAPHVHPLAGAGPS